MAYLIKDRRKPWQKKAAHKFTRCGSQLAENARPEPTATVGRMREAVRHDIAFGGAFGDAMPTESDIRRASIDDLERMLLALAWSRAWRRPVDDCPAFLPQPHHQHGMEI